MEQRLDRQDQRLGRVEVLLGRAIDDLGVLKGARAGDVAGKEAGLIARDIGLQYRKSLTGTELASLSDAVDTTGIAANELRSFHRADLIFEATGREGDLQYVAVEASWTVNGRDTVRATRNAGLLATFTGRRSHAVVAGVRRDDRIRHGVDAGEVLWYELPPSPCTRTDRVSQAGLATMRPPGSPRSWRSRSCASSSRARRSALEAWAPAGAYQGHGTKPNAHRPP